MYGFGRGIASIFAKAKAAFTPSPVRSHMKVRSAARVLGLSDDTVRLQAPTEEPKSCRSPDPNQGTRAQLDLDSAGAGSSAEFVLDNSGGNALRTNSSK
jgi:hypothetical protein